MNSDRIIVTNTLYQIVGKTVTSIFGFISIYFLTRHLGSITFSEYSFIIAYVGFVTILTDFGLTPYLIREIASDQDKSDILTSVAFTARGVLSVFASVVFLILIFILPYASTIRIGVSVGLISQFFLNLSLIIWSVFQARLKFQKMMIAQVASSALLLFLTLVGVYLNLGLLYFTWGIAGSAFIGFIVSLMLMEGAKLQINFDLKLLRKTLRRSLSFGMWVVVATLYFKVDTLILSFYFNPSTTPDVGYYSLAYRFFEVSVVFGGFFTQTLYPHFSRILKTSQFRYQAKRYLLWTFIVATLATGATAVCAKPAILLVAGAHYQQAIPPLMILSAATFVSVMSGFFSSIAFAGHKQKQVLKFGVFALFVNILGNLLLIPHNASMGAAVMTVVTQSIVCVACAHIAWSIYGGRDV